MYTLPLFDEIQVTQDDIDLWLEVIPRLDKRINQRYRDYYTKWWNVADKIRYAKVEGRWPPTRVFIA